VAGWFTGDPEHALIADAKTSFQEWAHAALRATPSYHMLGDSGIEDDEQRFTVEVRVSSEPWGTGNGRSKRLAERAAAAAALVRRAEVKPREDQQVSRSEAKPSGDPQQGGGA
jgi:ribonuclease-3